MPKSAVLEKSHIAERINQIQKSLEHNMPIRLVSQFSELPADVQMDAREKGIPGKAIKAVYVAGEIVVNQEAIKNMDELETTLHEELYGHYGFHRLYGLENRSKMNDLYQALGGDEGVDRLCQQHGIDLSPYRSRLANAPQETRQSIIAEEFLAHLATHSSIRVRNRRRDLIGSLRNWCRENNFIRLARYNNADIAHLLHRANKAARQGPTQKISSLSELLERLSGDGKFDSELATSDSLISAYVLLSQHDAAFRLPKVDNLRLSAIFDEGLGMPVERMSDAGIGQVPGAIRGWVVTTPSQQRVRIYRSVDSVWIDEATLPHRLEGQQVAHAVANFAINNHLKFIADPTDAAPHRDNLSFRLETMITSALRFGTTHHLSPHPLQREGSHGAPAINWVDGDDIRNVREMLVASYFTTQEQMPFIGKMVYNPDTQQFENMDFDFAYSRDQIGNMVNAARSAEDTMAPDQTTTERAILVNTIISQGDEQNAALLAHLGNECANRLNGILYSLSTDPEDWGQTAVRPIEQAVPNIKPPSVTTAAPDELEPTATPNRDPIDPATERVIQALHTSADALAAEAQALIEEDFTRGRKSVFGVPGNQSPALSVGYRAAPSRQAADIRDQARALRVIADNLSPERLKGLEQQLRSVPASELNHYALLSSNPDEQEALAYARILSEFAGQEIPAYAGTGNLGLRIIGAIDNSETPEASRLQEASVVAPSIAAPLDDATLPAVIEQLARRAENPESTGNNHPQVVDAELDALLAQIDYTLSMERSAVETDDPTHEQDMVLAGMYYSQFVLNSSPLPYNPEADDAEVISAMRQRLTAPGGTQAKDELSDDAVVAMAKAAYDKGPVRLSVFRNHLAGAQLDSETPRRVLSPVDYRPAPPRWIDDVLHQHQGALFQFAGTQALTANHLALAAARQFTKEGYDPEIIRQKTGWHLGEDDGWRYEISDHDARLRREALHSINVVAQRFTGRLGDILDHPKLFAAYPDLANTPIDLHIRPDAKDFGEARFHGGASIGGEPTTRQMSVIVTSTGDQQALSILLHEVQHLVQETENFARGASPQELKDQYAGTLAYRSHTLNERKHILDGIVEPSPVRQAESRIIADELEQIDIALEQIQNGEWDRGFGMVYLDVAGEREARETQRRQRMTPEERAVTALGTPKMQGRLPIIIQNDTPITEVAALLDLSPVASMTLLPRQSIMKLTQAATRSSFIHEAGHLFLEMEAKTSRHRPLDPLQTKIADYLGVKHLQSLPRAAHEKFARDFEQYMEEKQTANQDQNNGMTGVFSVVKGWLQNVCHSTQEKGERLSAAARAMFDELLETYERPHQDNLDQAEIHERKLAMQLQKTGFYTPGEAYQDAGLITAYALAKAERDPHYPSVARVFDHMNLTIRKATPEEMNRDMRFDWDTFNIDALARKQQAVSRAEPAPPGRALSDYDLSGEVHQTRLNQHNDDQTEDKSTALSFAR